MLAPNKTAALATLRDQVRRLERLGGAAARTMPALPLFPALDRLWPEAGLPLGCLHDVQSDSTLAGTAALSAFAGALAGRLTRLNGGYVLWCARGRDGEGSSFYAPGLAQVGLAPHRLLAVRASSDAALLAVMEEALAHPLLAAVVGEIERLSLTASRRLGLAAEKSGVTAFVLRTPPHKRAKTTESVAAAGRWRVTAAPSMPHAIPEAGTARLKLELLGSRAGAAGQWMIEAPDAQGDFRLSAALGHEPAQTPRAESRPLRLAAG
jgi:protein ImuA